MSQIRFLIAGVQKCGTSALDDYLRQHPQIEMASAKETHFFDRESGVDWRRPDYGLLHSHYTSDSRMWGEATPITLYWTPAHYRVLRYNPNMKFILLFRDPVERAWSHWKMNRANEWEDLDFSTAIRAGRMRVLDEAGPNGLSRRLSYVERGYYGRQINELLKLFDKSQCLFLRQDDLKQAPNGAVAQVLDFLELSSMPIEKSKVVNASRWNSSEDLKEEDRNYLEDLYKEDRLLFQKITGLCL